MAPFFCVVAGQIPLEGFGHVTPNWGSGGFHGLHSHLHLVGVLILQRRVFLEVRVLGGLVSGCTGLRGHSLDCQAMYSDVNLLRQFLLQVPPPPYLHKCPCNCTQTSVIPPPPSTTS